MVLSPAADRRDGGWFQARRGGRSAALELLKPPHRRCRHSVGTDPPASGPPTTLGDVFPDLLDDAYQRVAIFGFQWIPEKGVQALLGILNVRLVVAADGIADGGDDAGGTAQGGVAASGPPGGPAALHGIGRQSAGNSFLG